MFYLKKKKNKLGNSINTNELNYILAKALKK